jgi:hypothetical protein
MHSSVSGCGGSDSSIGFRKHPQSLARPYTGSPWNAYVKDALEDHLRGMVCSGQLDLATAQHEIAVNWIAAYKKYFRTRRPLQQHVRDDRTE